MADLSVDYCGLRYKTPFILASATLGSEWESVRLEGEVGFGGVILKTIDLMQDWAGYLCFFHVIQQGDSYRVLDQAGCGGCGLGVQWCTENAITRE